MIIKAHTRYRNKNDTLVPGTTTICGLLAKRLEAWSNRLGLQGVEYDKFMTEAGLRGTLAHSLSIAKITKEQIDTGDYSYNQIQQARNVAKRFGLWLKKHPIEMILFEKPLVSEEFQYGGTPDFYGIIGGKYTLVDLKTSKDIYPDHRMQLAAYWKILIELGHKVDEVKILRIGREEKEGYDYRSVYDLDFYWKRFKLCRDLYSINKLLKI